METKEKILNKARDLFFRYGFKSVSMDDIATNAGISKKTIYQFFTDKNALVNEIIMGELKCNEDSCMTQLQESDNAIHEIFLSMDRVSDTLRMANPLLIYELEKYHLQTYKKLTDHKNKFFTEVVKNNLQRGIKEGLYKPDLNIDILSKFRVSSSFLVFNADIFPHKKYSIIQIMEVITENFLCGVVTPIGQKLISKYKSKASKL